MVLDSLFDFHITTINCGVILIKSHCNFYFFTRVYETTEYDNITVLMVLYFTGKL